MCELILTGLFDGMKGQSNCVRLKELTAKKYSQKKKPLLLFFELLNLTSFCIGNKSEGQCFIERRM